MDEEPVLPEWVKTLIQAEKIKAYDEGREDGYRWAIQEVKNTLQRNIVGFG